MPTPLFSTIIPVLNNWELTKNCLQSLQQHTSVPYEVIVIDNASSDETVTELLPLGKSLFGDQFTRLQFKENKNFAPASNAGAEIAKASLLFFLNNDTILTPGWATPLLDALADNPTLGAVGPLLLYEDDTVQHLGATHSFKTVFHFYQHFPVSHPVVNKRRSLQMLTAAALMVPRSVFFEAGRFYEEYRNGFEDVELSLRMKALGKRLECIPSSVVYHLESKTPGRNDNNQNNADLLAQRCSHLFTVDYHRHLLADGFIPYLNSSFRLSARLSLDQSTKLNEMYEKVSPQELYEGVLNNPFWEEGAESLVSMLAAHRQHEAALVVLANLVRLNPTIERAKRLLKLAVCLKNESLIGLVEKELLEIYALQKENLLNQQPINQIKKIAHRQNDNYLLKLAKEWKSE